MPNPPPPYETTAEVLDRARALFGEADKELRLGLDPTYRRMAGGDRSTDEYLQRAAALDRHLTAGAQLAKAMLAAEDVDAAEEVDQQLGFYPTPLGQPIPTSPKILDALRERGTDGG